jgi:hypothetical protein
MPARRSLSSGGGRGQRMVEFRKRGARLQCQQTDSRSIVDRARVRLDRTGLGGCRWATTGQGWDGGRAAPYWHCSSGRERRQAAGGSPRTRLAADVSALAQDQHVLPVLINEPRGIALRQVMPAQHQGHLANKHEKCRRVSIPSSSGHVRRPEDVKPARCGARDEVSIPSSSGHVRRLGCTCASDYAEDVKFQSPLHRGTSADRLRGRRMER